MEYATSKITNTLRKGVYAGKEIAEKSEAAAYIQEIPEKYGFLPAGSKKWRSHARVRIGLLPDRQHRRLDGVLAAGKGVIVYDNGLERIDMPSGKTAWKVPIGYGAYLSSNAAYLASIDADKDGVRLDIRKTADGAEVRTVRDPALRSMTAVRRISISDDGSLVLLMHSNGIALIRGHSVDADFGRRFAEGKGRILNAVLAPDGKSVLAVREKGVEVLPIP
jgi:hypothetical protein